MKRPDITEKNKDCPATLIKQAKRPPIRLTSFHEVYSFALIITAAISLTFLVSSCSKSDPKTLLPYSGIQNGGFEYGDFTGWLSDTVGEVYISQGIEKVVSHEGTYMAMMATGFSDNPADWSQSTYLEQSFTIGDSATLLQFNWNFLATNFLVRIDEAPVDNFKVVLIDENNQIEPVYQNFILLLADQFEATSQEKGNLIMLTSEFGLKAYMTDWQTVTYNVEAFRGQEITLRFELSDADYENNKVVALLDNIQLFD